MSFFEAIILGLIQGLTEFLPVSSSGHLVVFESWLGLSGENLAFNVALHVGTVFSILCFYYRKILSVIEWAFIKRVIVTSIPTAAIGLGMKSVFDFDHVNLNWVAVFFVLTAALLFYSDKKMSGVSTKEIDRNQLYSQVTYKVALIIGIVQGLAVLPGVSRSGATISTALLLSCTAPVAAFYSFISSLPAIGGAALLELIKADVAREEIGYYVMGASVAFVFGYLALWALENYFLKKARMSVFSWYLVAVSFYIFSQSF